MIQCGTVAEWAGAVGSILSGLGAFFAAGVALWLAFDARKIKLSGHCFAYDSPIPVSNPRDTRTEVRLCLQIKNVGLVSAKVSNIQIVVSQSSGKARVLPIDFNGLLLCEELSLYFHTDADSLKSKLPVKLASGEDVKWTFSLGSVAKHLATGEQAMFPPNAEMQVSKMLATKAEAEKLQIHIYTSFGERIEITPESPVLNAIIEAMDKDSARM